MHVTVSLEIMPACSLPACRWIAVRVGVREPDLGYPSSSASDVAFQGPGPHKTAWFFYRLLARATNEHLDLRTYTVRVPGSASSANDPNDLHRILLVDILATGMFTDAAGSDTVPDIFGMSLDLNDMSTWDPVAAMSDTVLVGRYTVTMAELLTSPEQMQTVSIASMIGCNGKLANLSVKYCLFKEAELDDCLKLTINDPGVKSCLSFCTKSKDPVSSIYNVVWQDESVTAKANGVLELTLPRDIVLCYPTQYGLALAEKGEIGIPSTNVITHSELKKSARDLASLFSGSSTILHVPSNTFLGACTKMKHGTITIKCARAKTNINQTAYILIDQSLAMQFEWLRERCPTSISAHIEGILNSVARSCSDFKYSKMPITDSLPRLPSDGNLTMRDLSDTFQIVHLQSEDRDRESDSQWSLSSALGMLYAHIASGTSFIHKAFVQERTTIKASPEQCIWRNIYVLVLSSSIVYAESLHNFIRKNPTVILLIFAMGSNAAGSLGDLFISYHNVILLNLLQPDLYLLQNALLSITGCIRYNEESEKRTMCICGYHC